MAEEFLTLMADYEWDAQDRLSAIGEKLKNAGFTGRQMPGIPYHISLAVFPLEKENEAAMLTEKVAACFSPVNVHVSHIGLFAGGNVLFAAPDMSESLTALRNACGSGRLNGHIWTPHTTLLIDDADVIARAMPIVMQCFAPFTAKLSRLHLCAFWPMREIVAADFTGRSEREK